MYAISAEAALLDGAPIDTALLGIEGTSSGSRRSGGLTKEQRTAKAIAAELAPLVAPPSPVASDEIDAEDEDFEKFIDENGDIWALDANGAWTRMEEEEPPEDQWPRYLSPTANAQFVDLTHDTEEEYDDAA